MAATASGVSVEIDRAKIDHVNRILEAFPEKALRVYERSIRRALQAGRTQALREIRLRYDIPQKSLTEDHSYYTFSDRVDRASGGVSGYIRFGGSKIPLYRFHPVPKERKYTNRFVNGVSGWRVTSDIKAADLKGRMLPRYGFIATFPSGHTGIFARTDGKTASGKDKLREFWGFNVQDMLDYEDAREAIQKRMREIVEQRIDHELLRALEER